MVAVLLGLACAFLIGTANFTGGVVSKRDASLTIAFVGQLTTIPVMAVLLLCVPASSVAFSDVAWGLASGVIPVTGLASRTSGAIVGALMIAFSGGRYWISRNNPLGLLPGMFGVASLVLFVVASHHHMVATVSVVQALAPLFTALLAFFVLHQRLRPMQSLGLAIALGSTVLLAL
jgi:drug/metabolite transporter (DMT)-like permease